MVESTLNVADVAKELNFKFYSVLVIYHLNVNVRMWQVALPCWTGYLYGTEAEPLNNLTGFFHKREEAFLCFQVIQLINSDH